MVVSAETFERVALEDPEGHWELHCGRLRRKPGMTFEHNEVMHQLGFQFHRQLDRNRYRVRINTGHARRLESTYYIPDVFVIPVAYTEPLRGRQDRLEAYGDPLPLVVEVWLRSTGGYDVEEKFPEYRRRGDLEIWRIHPYERTLTAWRRQPDGSYTETLYQGGTVQPVALPGVTIDLDALFV